jgi:hypothetical protein
MQQASLKANQERVLDKELAHLSNYQTLTADKNSKSYQSQIKVLKSLGAYTRQ